MRPSHFTRKANLKARLENVKDRCVDLSHVVAEAEEEDKKSLDEEI